jgi:hypothetical protein
MAERRMFAKQIIDSDAFLDMPLSSQCLYFHLAMRADDDGFLNGHKKIQRFLGAADDDFNILLAKNFIIPFENGVCVIKHWRVHNYIQKDRYKETAYIEDKAKLSIKNNNAYTMDTQVRLGKVRLGKGTVMCAEVFAEFWCAYPKKVGKAQAEKTWQKEMPNIDLVLNALQWQKESKQWLKNAGQFIPNPATYLNQHRWLDEPVMSEYEF